MTKFNYFFFHLFSGVGMVLRKMGNSINPVVELIKNGDTYTFITSSTFKTVQIVFKEGEEFEEETADGRKVKSVITFENPNKLIQKQGGDKPSTLIREWKGDELHVVS